MPKFKVIVKPNSPENKLMGYDDVREAYVVWVKAKPADGEANKEVEKFLSKKLKKKVKIVSGFKSRIKFISF